MKNFQRLKKILLECFKNIFKSICWIKIIFTFAS